ncbi:DNA translocase FtsK [Veillonella sp. CHU110]|uniref:FtsK/SpoIIIE family DNA translocase n=1 Tax=Veillonella sp. CHU110 TaxID=2490947 RepID=UPI000F8C9AF7|nr:DNA translocase FtsK [Veillonella sp. CHU110]
MAEEKKGKQKIQSKRSSTGRSSKTERKSTSNNVKPTNRTEIKGLLVMAFAIVGLIGMMGVDTGTLGSVISGIFTYGFGLGGWAVAVWLLYNGWCWLYKGKLASVTRKGLLYTVVLLVVMVQMVLWKVPAGDELATTALADNGGVIGGLFGMLFRKLLGDMGGIFVTAVIAILCILGVTRLSLRQGLHKAKDTASIGLEIAQEKASETATAIREQVHEWKEEWREERRKAYDREKDMRYPKDKDTTSDLESEGSVGIEAEDADSTSVTTVVELAEHGDGSIEDTATVEPMQSNTEVIMDPNPVEDDDEDSYIPELEPREDEVTDDFSSNDTSGDIYSTDVDEEPYGTERSTTLDPITPPSFLQATNYVEPLVEVPTIETTKEDTAAVAVSIDGVARPRTIEKPYQYPPLTMLSQGKSNPVTSEEVAHNAVLLEETLDNFGITAKVVNATQGPTVTRYELEPAKGTKVSRIMGLQDDLKMSLAAVDIRMEAPIPGKSAVGIEIPNKNVSAVHLRDVLDCEEFQQASGGIPVGLGKDIADMPVITDLAKMPHLLVAGSTGSGKSVCVNTLISSILFSRKPDEVKLILVDPKMVELSVYNGIPHLMLPVVTDMNKAAAVLRWAVREMDARYMTLATAGVRNVASYNKQNPTKAMPLILIIIDELADLMMTNPDVEESIDRLAAKARAAGIHMVLATQRPSVDVITGKIKANVPSRIAFTVATQIDSRTILDQAGAERLLGRGDMLFNPIGANKPIRIQGAFISDEEVEELIAFVKGQGQPEYDEAMMAETDRSAETSDAVSTDEEQDELLERAVQIVLEQRSASASILQRRLRVGFSRAGRLIDTMQDMKIIGPPTNSSKGRDILMGEDQIRELYFPNFTVD